MKSFRFFLVIIFLYTLSYSNDYLDRNYSFGVNISKYDKINQNKIKSVVTRVSKKFGNVHAGVHKVNVTFVSTIDELINGYVNYDKFNSIVTYGSYYLKNEEKLKKSSQYIFTFDFNKEFQQYVIIVNNKANIKSLKDLKGKRFTEFVANDNYSDWLDYLTLKELKKPFKKIISKTIKVQKDSTQVLNLFFDKADFAVIRKSSFKDIVSLNPAIENKVKILMESKPMFLFGVGLIHKKAPKSIVDGFDKVVVDGTFDSEYQHLLKMLGNTKIKSISFSDLKDLENFYSKYQKLKDKYK